MKNNLVLVQRFLNLHRVSNRQWLTCISPFERVSSIAVIIANVMINFVFQVLLASEIAAFQNITAEERKPGGVNIWKH